MRKMLVFVLAALIFLTSCSNADRADTDTSNAQKSRDYVQGSLSSGASCAITNDTVYFKPFSSYSNIKYADKKTGISGALCGKPECTHTNSSCNAYVSYDVPGFSDYDGALYFTMYDGSNYHIYKEKYDGTDRVIVKDLDTQTMLTLNGDPFSFAHRGYMFYCGDTFAVEDGETKFITQVFAYSLEEDDDCIRIFEKKVPETHYTSVRMRAYNDDLYIMNISGDVTGDKPCLELYKWNINTQEIKTLYNKEVSFSASDLYITDDSILLSGRDGKIYFYSFEQKNISDYLDFNGESGAYAYVPVSNGFFIGQITDFDKRTVMIRVMDISGKLILDSSFSIDFIVNDQSLSRTLCGADENYVYNLYSDSPGSDEYLVAIPLDGSDVRVLYSYIGEG